MKIFSKLKKIRLKIQRLFRSKRATKRLPNKPRSRTVVELEPITDVKLPLGPKPFLAIEEFSSVQISQHTKRAYKRDLRDFFDFIRTQGVDAYWSSEMSPIFVAKYRDFLVHQKKLSKTSVTRKIAVLKSFFRWAQSRGWIEQNPADLIKGFPQTQDSKTGFLNENEITEVLAFLETINTESLSKHLAKITFETLLMLGIRRSEASSIKAEHLQYIDGQWLIAIQGKGNRERILPIPNKLLKSWSTWLSRISNEAPQNLSLSENPQAWLNWQKKHAKQPLLISTRAKSFESMLSTAEIARIVRKLGLKAGLVNRISPHMLRATAITYALDQGATHRGIQQMAGWTSPLMITRYDKRRNDPKISAVHQLKYAN